MYIFSPKGKTVTSLFIFLKDKKIPRPKVKNLCPKGQINIYIVEKKIDYFISYYFFNGKYISSIRGIL